MPPLNGAGGTAPPHLMNPATGRAGCHPGHALRAPRNSGNAARHLMPVQGRRLADRIPLYPIFLTPAGVSAPSPKMTERLAGPLARLSYVAASM